MHAADLATNKVSAAYGRQDPRDVVDLLTVRERILPLGAAVWASAGKAPGFTPEGIVNEIRRTDRYKAADFRHIASDPPVDPAATMMRFREILDDAEAFIARMPTEKAGLLFLKGGHIVQPIPGRWASIKHLRGRSAATGRPMRKSAPPRSSVTTSHQSDRRS